MVSEISAIDLNLAIFIDYSDTGDLFNFQPAEIGSKLTSNEDASGIFVSRLLHSCY